MVQNLYKKQQQKNRMVVLIIILGIWVTSDKQWNFLKVEIQWATVK